MDEEKENASSPLGNQVGDPFPDSGPPMSEEDDEAPSPQAPQASQAPHRTSSAGKVRRSITDWLRRKAMSGAMRSTAAETASQVSPASPPNRPTRHGLVSRSGGNIETSSTPPRGESMPRGRPQIPPRLSGFSHRDGSYNMGDTRRSGELSDEATRYSVDTGAQASSQPIRPSAAAYTSFDRQNVHYIGPAQDSSTLNDTRNLTPTMPHYNPLNSSPSAVIGNPANWLLPRPFRHEVEVPFVGETSYDQSEETGANFDIPSLSSSGSFSEREGISRVSTPSSFERDQRDNSPMRSPYFGKGKSVARPSEARTSSPFETAGNTSSPSHQFSTAAGATGVFPSEPFFASGSDRPSPQLTPSNQYQKFQDDSADNTHIHAHMGARHSFFSRPGNGSLSYPQLDAAGPRLTSPAPRPYRDAESEFAYGPSVISGPMAQTMTPNTSPYRREMAQVNPQGGSHSTNRPYPHAAAADRLREQNRLPLPPARVNRPPLDSPFHHRRQDSSILSPLVHPNALRYPLRTTTNFADHRMGTPRNRAETRTLGALDLDLSSDSEADDEGAASSYTLATGQRQYAHEASNSQTPSELTGEQDRVLCAISESRSLDMIGVAVINVTMGQVDLVRIVNDDRYRRLAETLLGMPTWPQTFLVLKKVVDQNSKSTATLCLEQEFPHAEVVSMDREHWNEAEGLKLVDRFAWRKHIKAIRRDLEHNFYVSCAFSAVMSYVEEETEVIFRDNSLRIKYKQPADTMGLDRATVTSLELFQNIRNAKVTSSTLFGLLNNTLTPQGRRMIRSALLQPSTNKNKITARYEAVEELSSNEDLFTEVRASLKRLFHIDVERSIPWVALQGEPRIPLQDGVALIQGRHQIAMPSHEELQGAEKDLNHILMVKAYLGGVQAIQETLEVAGCTSQLCKWVLERCRRENTAPIVNLIEEAIEQDAIYSKAPIDIRNNRMWAIKAEPNGVLEGARQMYRDRTNDMHQYVEALGRSFQDRLGTTPELRLGNDNHYYLRFQWSDVEREFARDQVATGSVRPAGPQHRRPRPLGGIATVNGIRRKRHYDCQTLELIQRSSQIQRHADIVTTQSDRFIVDLKKSLLEHGESLLAVNEAVAVLDMLCSFAHLATTQNYVRPIISDNLVLKGARHPVVEVRKEDFVPNDVYLGDQGARFQVVTGGNMSGKSTFIRTIALIQIMAQVGSFVPATYAAVPICDRLFTRLSTEDKPESNMGTFAVEMTEMNMILRQVTKDSLVIIDELGRGTATKEGLSIALAMSEDLIKTECRVFFATHFTELARVLNATKPNSVLNVHVAGESTKTGDTAQISLPHTIAPGPVKNEDYGLDLSRRFLPERVVKNAEHVCKFLRQRNSGQATGPATRAVKQNKLILALPGLLKQATNSTMDDSAFASYMNKLQTEFTIRMDITTDDDAQAGPSGKDTDQAIDLPTLEKPSEEELEDWKKKSDTAESRVMQANMTQSQDKKRPASAGGDNDCLQKRSKISAGAESTISQPTPINRGSMIEELRRGACTPTTRAATPSSITTDTPELQADSVMDDAPAGEDTPADEVFGHPGTRQRAVSISSGSNYDEDMPDVDKTSPRDPGRPSPGAYSDLAQPLERFQPLREWYAREQQAAGSSSRESEERSTPRNLERSRSATQEFLRGLHEADGEDSE